MVMAFVIPSAKWIRYRLCRTGLECFTQFDRIRHRLVQLVLVKFTFRAADDDAGDAVADQIGQRPAFAHELVDADKNGDRLDRYIRHDRKRRRQRDEARSRNARGALRGDDGNTENAELLPDRQYVLVA